MDPYSRLILKDVFEEMIQWRMRENMIPDQLKLQWNRFHLFVIHGYVLNSGVNSDSRLLSIAKLLHGTLWNMPESSTVYAKMVASFTQLLQQFFVVPTQHQLLNGDNNLKRNELVAGFINFLLLLLYYKTDLSDPFKDRIAHLEKELRFLLTVLGDILFVYYEHEQFQNFLAQFESVANKAGTLVHSFFFSKNRVFETTGEGLDEGFGATFKQIDHLKDDIIKFLNLLPSINRAYIAPKTSIVDSPLLDSLLYDLEDLLNQDDSMISDLKDHIKTLHQELIVLQSLTKDTVAQLPSENIEELKESLVGIPDEAHEAEYLIKSFLVGDAPLWYFSIRLSQFIHKIKLSGIQLQEIKKNYTGALKVTGHLRGQLSLQGESNSKDDDDVTVGSEEKATDILDQLVGGEVKRQIICIYGMPGIGKTTLAKKLYNHPSVYDRFDRRSWCVVSQTYQRQNTLTELLISLASEFDKSTILKMGDEVLVENIYKTLKGRRYLIVLDDIWSSNVWDDLQRCFADDGNGSRILFTSRNEDVAPPPPDSVIHRLPFLSDQQCWELLQKKVFHSEHCPPELQGIGMEIAKKCCGLPLAVVVIAGILSTMDKEETTWKKVAVSLASYIFPDQNNRVMQILELSYKHLPAHLKSCFLYFHTFQEYKEIPVRELIKLWIAEGFIRKEEKKSLESLAEESLTKLIDKSLVMVAKRSSDGRVKTCIVHDLLRDLCLNICNEVNFVKVVDNDSLSYVRGYRLLSFQHPATLFGHHVRSFHGYPPVYSPFYAVNVKLLRVLNFKADSVSPYLVGTEFLVQLRYLVTGNFDACIGSLVNLEYLRVENEKIHDDDHDSNDAKHYNDDDNDDQTDNDVDDHPHHDTDDRSDDKRAKKDRDVDDDSSCGGDKDNSGVEIPCAFLKMVKLRYLYLANLASFDKDCESSQTNNLEFLSNVFIRNFSDEEILKCSPHLRKLKCTCKPFQMEKKGACRYPDFSFFTQLQSLNMTTRYVCRMADISLPSDLKKLTLSELLLPWEKMSIIGKLPKLQVLKLLRRAFSGQIWETKEDEFEQLTFLKLEKLDLLEWNVAHSQHFPKLRQLVVQECRSLQEIPFEMGEIATLQLIDIRLCPMSLQESAQQIEREQRDNGNEELRVVLTGVEYMRGDRKSEKMELID